MVQNYLILTEMSTNIETLKTADKPKTPIEFEYFESLRIDSKQ